MGRASEGADRLARRGTRAGKKSFPALDLQTGSGYAPPMAVPPENQVTPSAPLTGKTVAVAGKLPKATHATVHASLERLGANVTKKPSLKTDLLVLGGPPGFEAIDALDSGIPFLLPDDLADLERGAPLARYVGRRDLTVQDPASFASRRLDELHDALVAIDTGGEVWHDELTLTIHPSGRLSARLRELGGTPTEDHVRRVLQREDWPRVTSPCNVSHPITFGPIAL